MQYKFIVWSNQILTELFLTLNSRTLFVYIVLVVFSLVDSEQYNIIVPISLSRLSCWDHKLSVNKKFYHYHMKVYWSVKFSFSFISTIFSLSFFVSSALASKLSHSLKRKLSYNDQEIIEFIKATISEWFSSLV